MRSMHPSNPADPRPCGRMCRIRLNGVSSAMPQSTSTRLRGWSGVRGGPAPPGHLAHIFGKPATHVVRTPGGIRAATLCATHPHGNFALESANASAECCHTSACTTRSVGHPAPTELELTGRYALAAYPEGALTVTLEDAQNNRAVFPASASTSEGFVVRSRSPYSPSEHGAANSGSASGGFPSLSSRRTSPLPSGAAVPSPGTPNPHRAPSRASPCRSRRPTSSGL